MNATNGVATFGNLAINNAGNGYSLIASSSSLASAVSSAFTISNPAPTALSFNGMPSSLVAGTCSGALNVVSVNSSGVADAVLTNTTVTLGASQGSLYSDSACKSVITSAVIAKGSSSASFYAKSNSAQGDSITAQATGLTQANASIQITASSPYQLAINSAPQTDKEGACSSALAIGLQDAYGNVTKAGNGGIAVGLSGTTLAFYTDSACTKSASSISIASGGSSVNAYFMGSAAGSDTLKIAATSLVSAIQTETITNTSTQPMCNQPLSTVPVPNAPHGIFSLQFAGSSATKIPSTSAAIMDAPTVCGVTMNVVWAFVDKGPDANGVEQYDWSFVDEQMAPWLALGKSVNLVVWGVSDNLPNDATPSYVLNNPNYKYVTCNWSNPPIDNVQLPVYYSPVYMNAYQIFLKAVIQRYGNNKNVGYIRAGLSKGGEVMPTCMTQMEAYSGVSNSKDFYAQVWEPYLAAMTKFQKEVLSTVSGASTYLMAAIDTDTTWETANAVSLGMGFGNQGSALSDVVAYNSGDTSGCSGNWCELFTEYHGQVPLELQQFATSDPTNQAGGEGSLAVLIPFEVKLYAQILEIYENDLALAYDQNNSEYKKYCPNGPPCAYSTDYQNAFQNAASVLGGR